MEHLKVLIGGCRFPRFLKFPYNLEFDICMHATLESFKWDDDDGTEEGFFGHYFVVGKFKEKTMWLSVLWKTLA